MTRNFVFAQIIKITMNGISDEYMGKSMIGDWCPKVVWVSLRGSLIEKSRIDSVDLDFICFPSLYTEDFS